MFATSMLGLVALAISTTNAFMIPPTMSLPNIKGDGLSALVKHITGQPSGKTVKLDCHGCSFTAESEAQSTGADLSTVVVVDFSFSDDGKTLLINDAPLYPPSTSQTIHAIQQLSSEHSSLTTSAMPREISYDMGVRATDASDGSIEQLIDLDLMINQLDHERVHLDKMVIQLFKDEEGRLSILGDIAIHSRRRMPFYREPTSSPERLTVSTTDLCGTGLTSILCRWRLFVTPKLTGLGRPGCHGRHRWHGRVTGVPVIIASVAIDTPETITADAGSTRVHHVGDDNRHRHRHNQQEPPHQGLARAAHAVRYVLVTILIPVLVGVAAGMTASLLGMMVGTVIAWLWIKFVRGGKKGSASRLACGEEEWIESAGLLGEKSGYVAEEVEREDLPAYVDAPVYVEKE